MNVRHIGTLPLLAAALIAALPADARTIVIDGTKSDRMAGIAEPAPRQSWAMNEPSIGVFSVNAVLLARDRSFLIRFPLDSIPAGARIAHAELILPVTQCSGSEPRFYLWRILADWGPGVSYVYRKAESALDSAQASRNQGAKGGDNRANSPTNRIGKIEWTRPGARGDSSDRATRPTDIARLTEPGDVTINVTEDVELWHTGMAANQGWMLTVEDPGTTVLLKSPVWEDGAAAWRLRITYEPTADKQ